MYFFLGTHTEPLGAQTLNEKQFINLLWIAESDSLMQSETHFALSTTTPNEKCVPQHYECHQTRFRFWWGWQRPECWETVYDLVWLSWHPLPWDAVEQKICRCAFPGRRSGVPFQDTGQSSKLSCVCAAGSLLTVPHAKRHWHAHQEPAAAQHISAWTCVQLLTKQTKIKCLRSVWMLISQTECCFVYLTYAKGKKGISEERLDITENFMLVLTAGGD